MVIEALLGHVWVAGGCILVSLPLTGSPWYPLFATYSFILAVSLAAISYGQCAVLVFPWLSWHLPVDRDGAAHGF